MAWFSRLGIMDPSMERRVRTYFVVRQRFRRIAMIASIAGLLVALIPILVSLLDLGTAAALQSRSFVVYSILLLLVGGVVPRWVVFTCWNQVKRRRREEWQ